MIAGNGTAGLEIAEDVPNAKTVLVPVGGGGLATGIAIAVKARLPSAKVFGVQPEGAASLPTALKTGRGFHLERPETIADGIGVGLMLPPMAELLKRHLDGCLLVSDDDIRASMRRLALDAKVVAEPAGAASLAAWSRHRETLEPPVVAVVSGGNVDPALLAAVLK
jgi:threonine dehydratase